LPGRKGRLLFTLMALNRHRTFSRNELIDVLWPRVQPTSPDAALSTVLSRLRRALGEELVQGRTELSLALPEEVSIDAELAEERVHAAAGALERGSSSSALEDAKAAAELLDDTLLPEFDDAWVEERRRDLAELLATALEVCARAALAVGEVAAARGAARRLIEREPWRESGYVLLMQAHAQAGDVAEALRVFERLRVLLRDELGMTPSSEARELHQQLLSGDWVAPSAPSARAPVRAVPTKAPAARQVALPPVLASLTRSPFAGRQAQLQVLEERWREVVAGHDGLVLLAGQPGMGKTILAARLAERVHRDGATVLFGQCDPHAVMPYQPIAQALRHFFEESAGSWDDAELPTGAGELGRIVPKLRDAVPEDRPSVAPEPEAQRFQLFDAILAILARAADERPLLLVIDDAHWADSSTVLLLRHLVREPDRLRLMVLVTYRDSEVPADHPLHQALTDLGRTRPIERLALEGFDEDETAELIGAFAGERPAPVVRRGWQERTDGHPFFLHELLRSAGAAAAGASPDADVPFTVRELILRHVSQLGADSAAMLGTAAVIGREFDLDVLTAVIGESTDATIAGIEEAMEHGLVDEAPDRFDRFSFRHALVHEVLYEQHSRTRCARLHHRVGELLEHAPSGASPAEVAHHYFEARHVAGAEPVARHCMRAAVAAVDALAYEEAAEHYKRALEALEQSGPEHERERCELLLALGETQWRAGDVAVDATFARAADSARDRGDSRQLARAALGGRNYERGEPDRARVVLLEEALAAFVEDEHPVLRVRVLGRLAEALHFAGEADRALAVSAEAMARAEQLEDSETLVAALMGRHAALMHIDHVDERLPLLRDLIALAECSGRADLAAHGHQWRTHALLEMGHLDQARVEQRAFTRIAEELREPGYTSGALAWRSLVAQLDGEPEVAEQLTLEGASLAERVRGFDAVGLAAAQLFFIRRDQGRLGELVPAVEAYVESSDMLTWRAGLTIALAEAGETARARRSLEVSMANDPAALPRDMWWLPTMALLAEGCALLSDADRALRLHELLLPYAERGIQVAFATHLGSVQRPLALLAGAAGQWDAAQQRFEAALVRHAGSRALTVRTQCEFAQMLGRAARPGDTRRASELLASASAAAGSSGLRELVERAARAAA
jgi:DNA-binding SARP family transcriptional activator